LWSLFLSVSPYSMWVYCAHEPLMGCVLEILQPSMRMCVVVNAGNVTTPEHHGKQFCRHVVSPVWFLVLYAFGPLLWIAMLLLIGVPLSRYAPVVFELLTGGRGKSSGTKSAGVVAAPAVRAPEELISSAEAADGPAEEANGDVRSSCGQRGTAGPTL
jgi:hypothetical protein